MAQLLGVLAVAIGVVGHALRRKFNQQLQKDLGSLARCEAISMIVAAVRCSTCVLVW